jgi:hypothetical protein
VGASCQVGRAGMHGLVSVMGPAGKWAQNVEINSDFLYLFFHKPRNGFRVGKNS